MDFGFGSRICYADGVTPALDGNITIKEAPPTSLIRGDSSPPASWIKSGVDISVQIREEDMKRLLEDPLLLPASG